jgi:hypothetical protein
MGKMRIGTRFYREKFNGNHRLEGLGIYRRIILKRRGPEIVDRMHLVQGRGKVVDSFENDNEPSGYT